VAPEITEREEFSERSEGEGTVSIFRTEIKESWKHTTQDQIMDIKTE
jgi:hypothetical protein